MYRKTAHLFPMQRGIKGFVGIFVLAGAAIISLLVSAAFVRYETNKTAEEQKLGATVYTTQLTDTINTFRQQVNSSTANLNTELSAVSSTILSYGTIVSQNSPLPTAAGGTATTTAPSNAQFLSANGTSPAWKTLIVGAGLNSTTTATTTQIGTTGFDNTADISFTGNNSFSNTSTFNGVVIFNATTTFNTTTTFSKSLITTASTSLATARVGGAASPNAQTLLSVGTSTNVFSVQNNGLVVVGGHLIASSTAVKAPSIASCGGGSPSIAGTDVAGKIVTGATPMKTCRINFGTSWANAPSCSVYSEDGTTVTTVSSTVSSVSFGATDFNNTILRYICIGY